MSAVALALATALQSAPGVPAKTPLACETGPVERALGGTQWIVYACSDGATVVVASGPNNPAKSFYFILTPKDGHYDIYGEGNGDKAASDAAGDAIRAMGDSGILDLLKAAQAIGKQPK